MIPQGSGALARRTARIGDRLAIGPQYEFPSDLLRGVFLMSLGNVVVCCAQLPRRPP